MKYVYLLYIQHEHICFGLKNFPRTHWDEKVECHLIYIESSSANFFDVLKLHWDGGDDV